MSGALKAERVRRVRKNACNEFQTVGAMKLKERSPTDFRLRLGIFKSFLFDGETVSVRLLDARSVRLQGKAKSLVPFESLKPQVHVGGTEAAVVMAKIGNIEATKA